MADFDLTITWRKLDGSTEDFPATVCYRDDVDDLTRRLDAIGNAIVANLSDFPEDIDPENCVPVKVVFADA